MTPAGGDNGPTSAIRTNESRAWQARLIFYIAHNAAGRELTFLPCFLVRALRCALRTAIPGAGLKTRRRLESLSHNPKSRTTQQGASLPFCRAFLCAPGAVRFGLQLPEPG